MGTELLLGAAVAAIGAGWLIVDGLQRRPALSWLTLHWPRTLDAGSCLAVLRQLATDRRAGVVVIETSATALVSTPVVVSSVEVVILAPFRR